MRNTELVKIIVEETAKMTKSERLHFEGLIASFGEEQMEFFVKGLETYEETKEMEEAGELVATDKNTLYEWALYVQENA